MPISSPAGHGGRFARRRAERNRQARRQEIVIADTVRSMTSLHDVQPRSWHAASVRDFAQSRADLQCASTSAGQVQDLARPRDAGGPGAVVVGDQLRGNRPSSCRASERLHVGEAVDRVVHVGVGLAPEAPGLLRPQYVGSPTADGRSIPLLEARAQDGSETTERTTRNAFGIATRPWPRRPARSWPTWGFPT